MDKKIEKKIIYKNPKDLKIHSLNKELFSDLPTDEYNELKDDISNRGIQDPLQITENNIIISGHQRNKIAIELDIEVPCIIRNDLTEDWQIEEQLISDNLLRRHLSDYQKVECGERLRDIERGKAKQRQSTKELPENLREVDKHKRETNAILANKVGMSGRQYDKARKVYHEAPEPIKKKWQKGDMSTNKAYNKIKKIEKQKEIKDNLSKNTKPMPKGTFGVVYADPPWRYDYSETTERKIENQYPTMSLSEIKEMELPDIKDDAVLYLWATAPKLTEALEVMKAWEFKYKTHAIWDKQKIGMGYWFRGQHELLLVGTKGKFSPPKETERISSILSYPRTKHSKKPDEIRKLIHDWFPLENKIELFAREEIEGWSTWGNE